MLKAQMQVVLVQRLLDLILDPLVAVAAGGTDIEDVPDTLVIAHGPDRAVVALGHRVENDREARV